MKRVYEYEWYSHYFLWIIVGVIAGLITAGKTSSFYGLLAAPAVMVVWFLLTIGVRSRIKRTHEMDRADQYRKEEQRKAQEEASTKLVAYWDSMATQLGCPGLKNNHEANQNDLEFVVYYLSPTGELRVHDGGLDEYLKLYNLTDKSDRPNCCIIEERYRDKKRYMIGWFEANQLWKLDKFELTPFGVELTDFAYPRSQKITAMFRDCNNLKSVLEQTLQFISSYTSASNATLSYLGVEGAKLIANHTCGDKNLGGLRVCLQLGEKMFAEDHRWGETQFNPYHYLTEHDQTSREAAK